MTKKLLTALVATLITLPISAKAAEPTTRQQETIAIIDTALDTSLSLFKDRIAYEVCIVEFESCPNGKPIMEGPGSATLPVPQVYSGGFGHGTQMSLVATRTNPNINIVFIRIFPMDRNGNVATSAANANSTVKQALDWVITNKTKFNIVAVSASVGQRPTKRGANYCSINRFDAGLKSSIASLKSIGVASAFAAGNDRDKARINYPACLSDSVAIASISDRGNTETYNNDSADIDFYALGRYELPSGNVSGTSSATAAFAAFWAKSYSGSYQTTYDSLKSIAITSDTNRVNTVIDVLK